MIIVITGPTALGKSETAVKIASLFNAEIINGDAFQIYKEMNVGVAKPSKELMDKIPHHLYSLISPNEPYSIAQYQKDLREKINEIYSKNKNVVLVGGSGLYIRAGLYDYEFQEEDEVDLSKYEKYSNEELFMMLQKVDPKEANKLHPNNRKRVIRALHIYESTSTKKSELVDAQNHLSLYKDTYFFVRDFPREELYERINNRVDEMMKNGLLEEVKEIYKKYGDSVQSMQAIGYKEFIPFFKGEDNLNHVVELIKQHTRNYAKRQMTFIRHQFPTIFYKNDEELIKIIKEHENI